SEWTLRSWTSRLARHQRCRPLECRRERSPPVRSFLLAAWSRRRLPHERAWSSVPESKGMSTGVKLRWHKATGRNYSELLISWPTEYRSYSATSSEPHDVVSAIHVD